MAVLSLNIRSVPPEALTCLTIPLLRTGAGAGAEAAGAALISSLSLGGNKFLGFTQNTVLLPAGISQHSHSEQFLHKFPVTHLTSFSYPISNM